jgi:hypothetical protein
MSWLERGPACRIGKPGLTDLGEQTGANQRSYVPRVNRLNRLLARELVDLSGHPASNLRGTVSAVEHLDSGRVCCSVPD